MSAPTALRPLSVRAYRLVFIGSGLSNIGTWMHRVAVDWLVYQQTGSLAWVGLVSFAQFAPLAVLGPLGGVLADRFDRVRLLLAAQAFMMCGAAGLTIAQAAGVAGPVVLLLASVALGLGFAVAGPAWQATIPRLVPPDMLTSAIALNSSKMSVARIAGPAVGGILLASVGATGVFALNTVSYVAVIVALAVLAGIVVQPAVGERSAVRRQLAAGIRYALADRRIRILLLGVMAVSFLATPLITLLPAYAHDVLHGDAATLGLLTSALGGGALIGSLVLAQFGDRVAPHLLIGGSVVALGAVTALVGTAPGAALTAAAVLGAGLLRLGATAAANTKLQAHAEEAYRGRVMGLFMLGFGAAYPLGALLVGALADVWGVQVVTVGMGVATALVGVLVWRGLAAGADAPEPATGVPQTLPGAPSARLSD